MSAPTSTPAGSATPPVGGSAVPGVLFASLRVFDLSLSEMLWSRRTVFMGLIVGLPVLLSVILRVLVTLGLPMVQVGHQGAAGGFVFGMMMWVFFVRLAVPVLAVFYGTSLIADEVDDKTITYLFTRPIPRSAVVYGKYLAYLACTGCVVLPSVLVCWILIVPMGGSLGASFPDLLKDLAVLAIGLAVYGAVFACVGALLNRPLLAGLLFVLGWEVVIMVVPGYLKRLTVAYYLQGLVPHALPSDSPVSLLQSVFREVPSLTESLVMMAILTVAGLWLAGRTVANREYVLEQ